MIAYDTIRSDTTQSYITRAIKDELWSSVESAYAESPVGTSALVFSETRYHIVTNYVVTRTDTGYVRTTVVFREGESLESLKSLDF
jgi:deoxyinosine 3'endonuclease (endonuclease V)